jgi:hypothetical protein
VSDIIDAVLARHVPPGRASISTTALKIILSDLMGSPISTFTVRGLARRGLLPQPVKLSQRRWLWPAAAVKEALVALLAQGANHA